MAVFAGSVILAAFAAGGAAAQTYRVIDLSAVIGQRELFHGVDTWDEPAYTALLLNRGGAVVGRAHNRGFIYDRRQGVRYFDEPAGSDFYPQAVNDRGEAAGVMRRGKASVAAARGRADGRVELIEGLPLENDQINVRGLNNAGQVLLSVIVLRAEFTIPNGPRVHVYEERTFLHDPSTGLTEIVLPLAGTDMVQRVTEGKACYYTPRLRPADAGFSHYLVGAQAAVLAEDGKIYGRDDRGRPWDNSRRGPGFMYLPGQGVSLLKKSGGVIPIAAGSADKVLVDRADGMAIFDGQGRYRPVPGLPGGHTRLGRDINRRGEAVGIGFVDFEATPFLYRKRQGAQAINCLVPNFTRAAIEDPLALNDRRWILALGRNLDDPKGLRRSYLLVPDEKAADEPAGFCTTLAVEMTGACAPYFETTPDGVIRQRRPFPGESERLCSARVDLRDARGKALGGQGAVAISAEGEIMAAAETGTNGRATLVFPFNSHAGVEIVGPYRPAGKYRSDAVTIAGLPCDSCP